MSDENKTALYGLTAVPAQFPSPQSLTLKNSLTNGATTLRELTAQEVATMPDTPLARRIDKYARAKLPPQVYRHSRRVFAWGNAVVRGSVWGEQSVFEGEKGNIGDEKLSETWFVTAMLHDIGTPEETLKSTRLSYEFWAGFHAVQILQDASLTGDADQTDAVADREQAESVAEAVLRHQDVQDKGKVSLLTRLIHIGTLLDNIGRGKEFINHQTIDNVVKEWTRTETDGEGRVESVWTDCFRGTVELEKKHKPYAMVSRIEGFEDVIAKNGAKGGLFESQ
jgi:cyanamide hydratase